MMFLLTSPAQLWESGKVRFPVLAYWDREDVYFWPVMDREGFRLRMGLPSEGRNDREEVMVPVAMGYL